MPLAIMVILCVYCIAAAAAFTRFMVRSSASRTDQPLASARRHFTNLLLCSAALPGTCLLFLASMQSSTDPTFQEVNSRIVIVVSAAATLWTMILIVKYRRTALQLS